MTLIVPMWIISVVLWSVAVRPSNGFSLDDEIMMFSTSENTIESYNLRTQYRNTLIPAGRFFDFDFRRNILYWKAVDGKTVIAETLSNHGGSSSEIILNNRNAKTITAIALDWIHNNIYFGYYNGNIEVYNVNTKQRKIIHNTNRVIFNIRVDPRDNQGFMYWLSHSPKTPTFAIYKSGLDGTNVKELYTSNQPLPDIALDLHHNRLYWSKNGVIKRLDFNGEHAVDAKPLDETERLTTLSVSENNIYFSSAKFSPAGYTATHSVYEASKSDPRDRSRLDLGYTGDVMVMSLSIYSQQTQPKAVDRCNGSHNGCTHLCLPSPYTLTGYTCVSPEANAYQAADESSSSTSYSSLWSTLTGLFISVFCLAVIITGWVKQDACNRYFASLTEKLERAADEVQPESGRGDASPTGNTHQAAPRPAAEVRPVLVSTRQPRAPATAQSVADIRVRLEALFKKNIIFLSERLEYSDLRMFLLSLDIFTSAKIEEITSKPTNSEKIEEIILSLQNRPDATYIKFAWALMETDQTHHLRHMGVTKSELERIDMLMVVIDPVVP